MDTAWRRYRQWFIDQAKQESALRRGEPKRLDKTVAVTVDLCWSLRPYETKLFQTLKAVAAESKKKIHPVMFVSGRWLEQHPLEMHELVQLSLEPNIEIIWGHHSWDHPKAGGFMNDYPPPLLREDTLRLERLLLEWGIAPTVYYRFPGLIHDRARLGAILELDLFPIDCDSWLGGLVKRKDKGPFYYNVRDGGIILVPGNGNEPAGIPALQQLAARPPRLGTRTSQSIFHAEEVTSLPILRGFPGVALPHAAWFALGCGPMKAAGHGHAELLGGIAARFFARGLAGETPRTSSRPHVLARGQKPPPARRADAPRRAIHSGCRGGGTVVEQLADLGVAAADLARLAAIDEIPALHA